MCLPSNNAMPGAKKVRIFNQNYYKIFLRAPSTHVTPIKDSNSGSGGDGKEAENVDALVLVSCARPETLPDEVTKSC